MRNIGHEKCALRSTTRFSPNPHAMKPCLLCAYLSLCPTQAVAPFRRHLPFRKPSHSVVCLRRLQLPCHPPETHREPSLCMLCIVFWSTSSWG